MKGLPYGGVNGHVYHLVEETLKGVECVFEVDCLVEILWLVLVGEELPSAGTIGEKELNPS